MILAAVRVFILAVFLVGDETSLPVHTVTLIADHNSTFHVVDSKKPEVDLIVGEPVLLRVEAHKAKGMNRDGSVHGLLLMSPKGKPVPGWDLLFKPGVQEVQLTAPTEPGTYKAVCTVVCGPNHDQMELRVVVNSK